MNRIIEEDARTIISRVNINEIAGKTLLITGASGLIGTYLLFSIKEFVAQNANAPKVYAIIKNELPIHFKPLLNEEWITFIRGDLFNDEVHQQIPKADYIIHAAGYGQPAKFSLNPEKTIYLNTVLTFILLDKLNEDGKFLFVSSSGIYNGLQKEKFVETDIGTTNPMHPRACYIEGKRCGETICNAYRSKGLNIKSARLSYTYGPGVRTDDERALYSFIKKGFAGEIRLLDDGSAERIYCYIADVIEMLWNILLYGKEPVYNVGGTEKITILQLANLVAKIENVNIILPKVQNSVPGNAIVERLSIEQYISEFGEKRFLSINEGVKRTINWMQEICKVCQN